MQTGIIYRAFNKVSGKSYIGQSTRNLNIRKGEHLTQTIKDDYKFGRALRKYSFECWEWLVLAEVEIDKLNEYEDFFIKDLDTFKNGYNSVVGKKNTYARNRNSKYKNDTVYELWHPEFGEIYETVLQLSKRSTQLCNRISELVAGKRNYIEGYVLLKNKDQYDSILNIHSFYHPDHGVIKCTSKELHNLFPQYFTTKECNVYELTKKRCYLLFGWCLAENKNNYEKLTNKSSKVTLIHPEHGTKTLRRVEFKKLYNICDSSMTLLIKGKYKNCQGWKLPK